MLQTPLQNQYLCFENYIATGTWSYISTQFLDRRRQHVTHAVPYFNTIHSITVNITIICFLGSPCVSEEKTEDGENGGQWITIAINSIPAPCLVQWSAKGKQEATFTPIDINAEEYKGTSVTLPYPMLFVRQKHQLEKKCFRIEVTNFIGKTGQDIFG